MRERKNFFISLYFDTCVSMEKDDKIIDYVRVYDYLYSL